MESLKVRGEVICLKAGAAELRLKEPVLPEQKAHALDHNPTLNNMQSRPPSSTSLPSTGRQLFALLRVASSLPSRLQHPKSLIPLYNVPPGPSRWGVTTPLLPRASQGRLSSPQLAAPQNTPELGLRPPIGGVLVINRNHRWTF